MNPISTILGVHYVFMTQAIASIPLGSLGPERDRIVGAIDALLSGIYHGRPRCHGMGIARPATIRLPFAGVRHANDLHP